MKVLILVHGLPIGGTEIMVGKLARFFAEEQEWPLAPACLLDEAAAAVGREPGDYTSKLDVPLRREQMAVDALRRVLLTVGISMGAPFSVSGKPPR